MGRLAPRWPVLVIAGLIGAIAAFIFVGQRNSEVEPVYSAEAVVEIPSAEADDGRGPVNALSGELSTALELAKTVNEDAIRREGRTVEADGATNLLVFGAIDATEEAAIAAVTSMRAAYVAEDPNFDVDAELAKKLGEAGVIRGRLDDLLPEPVAPVVPTPEEAAASEAQLIALQSREAAHRAKIDELNDSLIDAASEDVAGLQAAIENRRADLQALLVELRPLEAAAAAADAPEGEPEGDGGIEGLEDLPLADQWTIQALEARLTELQTESASLIVASVTGTGIVLPDAEVVDESPSVTPTWLGLVVGFLAGIVLWSAVLVGFDRARGIIWQAGDIKNVSVLTEGPAIGLNNADATDLELHRRKRSVQAVRSASIGAGRLGQGTIVGFASPPSTDPDVRDELAHDVGASLSAVGRSVLVVDLGFTGTSFVHDGSGLRQLFDSVGDDENTIRERATAAIKSADRRAQGLDILTADSDVIDPADILAGRPLTELLNQAREEYDVVLVIQPTTTVNSGAGVDAYLQQQVIVCTRGKTRVSELNTIAIPRDAGHVQLVGAAILVPESGVDRPRRSDTSIATSRDQGVSESYAASGTDGRGNRKVSSALKRFGPGEKEPEEGTRDRLRALESYSVEESALLQSESSPERK
jgi:ABC-type amino acid transport substrate-binding protein